VLAEPRPRPTYSPIKTLVWIGAIIFGLLVLLVAWAIIAYWPRDPSVVKTLPSLYADKSLPSNLNDPPIYPGAQDAKVVSSKPCGKEITFTTPDSNARIANYYKDALPKSGWQQPYENYGDLFSRWIKYSLNGTQLDDYGLVIAFTGYSKKVVRLIVGNCYQQQEQEYLASLGTASPTPTPPAINITRQQYEEALAKWQASGVDEYEITKSTITPWGGTTSVHVSDHGKTIHNLRPDDSSWLEPDESDTVEGMFKEVDELLRRAAETDIATAMAKDGSYDAFAVEFDPDLGYPVSIAGYAVTAPGHTVFDGSSYTTVKEVKIIKKSQWTP
jgi:hypothetical protein